MDKHRVHTLISDGTWLFYNCVSSSSSMFHDHCIETCSYVCLQIIAYGTLPPDHCIWYTASRSYGTLPPDHMVHCLQIIWYTASRALHMVHCSICDFGYQQFSPSLQVVHGSVLFYLCIIHEHVSRHCRSSTVVFCSICASYMSMFPIIAGRPRWCSVLSVHHT